MADAAKVWELWRLAKSYGCQPSMLLRLEGVEAFFLDRAVGLLGVTVEAELEAATQGKKGTAQRHMAATMVLHKWTGLGQFK